MQHSPKITRRVAIFQIGLHGYQKTQNFTLIPNPKTKLKKTHDTKVIIEKLPSARFFKNTFLFVHFFTILYLDLESAFFGTHIDLNEEKKFPSLFCDK